MAKKPRAAAKKSGNGEHDPGRRDPAQPGSSQHVIDTALNLAAEKGWRDLALADIAQAAGMSLAELYGLHPSKQAILDAYAKAIRETPKLKLILLTHLSHRTGLIVPVKEIAAMAREKNIDVILDAAHSWGQVDFQIADLGVDFIGFNLHKWIGAPVGIGFLYIRKGRLDAIDRHYGDGSFDSNDIRTRVHTGTANFATILTLPLALKLHETIGTPAKAARLRYLRDRWVAKARALPNIEVLTPDEPGLAAGITSFRVRNKGSREDNNALVAALRDKHRVLTVRRDGVAKGQCIRVSPALYTSEEEIDRFVAALAAETGTG